MERIHQDVLRKCRSFLVKNMVSDVLWPVLVEEGIFNDEMMERIQSSPVNGDRIQNVLRMLPRRGPTAFDRFVSCLENTEQEYIAEKLREMEDSMRQGTPGGARTKTEDGSQKRTQAEMSEVLSAKKCKQSGRPQWPAATLLPPRELSSPAELPSPAELSSPNTVYAEQVSQVSPRKSCRDSRSASPGYETTTERAVLRRTPRKNLVTLMGTHTGPSGAHLVPDNGGVTNGAESNHRDISNHFGIAETLGRLDINVCDSSGVTFDPERMYPMESDPRGYCLIINNRYFSGHLRERQGSDVDRDNLYLLFSKLGYQIDKKENLTGMEMLITLRDFSRLDIHKHVDSMVVVILTHGKDGHIYGTDCMLVGLKEVFSYFDGAICPALIGKPKFFIVQSCRGEKYDSGFDLTDTGSSGGPDSQLCSSPVNPYTDTLHRMQRDEAAEIDNLRRLPTSADFLIAYATIPGFVSWRNSEQGSWFVQALCQVFGADAHREDAMSMLVHTSDRVATVFESATKHKQMPAPVCLLRKKFFFFPTVTGRMPVTATCAANCDGCAGEDCGVGRKRSRSPKNREDGERSEEMAPKQRETGRRRSSGRKGKDNARGGIT